MTREEAYKLAMQACRETWNEKTVKQIEEALKQEPCEDAISRQAALEKAIDVPIAKVVTEDKVIYRKIIFVDDIKNLPPITLQQKNEDIAKAFQFGLAFGFGEKHDEMDRMIDEIKKVITPQPETAHWIYKQYDGYPECGNYHCSECDKIDNHIPAYCPHCGCAMVEPQESEE